MNSYTYSGSFNGSGFNITENDDDDGPSKGVYILSIILITVISFSMFFLFFCPIFVIIRDRFKIPNISNLSNSNNYDSDGDYDDNKNKKKEINFKTLVSNFLNFFSINLENNYSKEECSICIEKLNGKEIVKLSCNHIFHKDCIEKYILINNEKSFKCPLCRENNIICNI